MRPNPGGMQPEAFLGSQFSVSSSMQHVTENRKIENSYWSFTHKKLPDP
jgi:hypothetical protein